MDCKAIDTADEALRDLLTSGLHAPNDGQDAAPKRHLRGPPTTRAPATPQLVSAQARLDAIVRSYYHERAAGRLPEETRKQLSLGLPVDERALEPFFAGLEQRYLNLICDPVERSIDQSKPKPTFLRRCARWLLRQMS